MDSEHRELVIKTRELIETTRHEISQLREEIDLTWESVDQSQRLLLRIKPLTHRIARRAKVL